VAMISQTCVASGQIFFITEADQNFYKKMGVPVPKICPDERCRRRLAWQNMRYLYRRKCDATGKAIISNISPDKSLTVYEQSYWWSDKWDARDYGKGIDFTRSFFDQWKELLQQVPQPCMLRNYWLDENCDFTNYAGNNKNCYLIFHADMNRDCLFGVGVKKCTNVVDVIHNHSSELLYECIDCRNCYDTTFAQNAENCSNCHFIKNCVGCQHCFGCVNLCNKKYHLFNKPVTPAEYEKHLQGLELSKYSRRKDMREHFGEFLLQFPHRSTEGYQNENCEGDQIFHCKNAKRCFDVQESRDMKYCHRIYNGPNSDCYDVNEYGMHIQQVYEGLAIGINAQNIIAGIYVNEQVSDICYGMHSHHSQHLFGCIGIRRGKHCIFNQSYTVHEYEKLKKRLIDHMIETGEWGEFFPIKLSPFAYNETVAQEYFPLTKVEAIEKGYNWRDETKNTKYIGTKYKVPDNITDVPDSICNEILTCEVTGKNYRIQKQELKFYRQQNLPIPRLHPDERHRRRVELRNPRKLWSRKCDKCQKNIQTTFSPDRSEKILCEAGYLNVVN
jgi:hypothetical protein